MATDEQIIIDIQVQTGEIEQAKKRIDVLSESITELGDRISGARKQNQEYLKAQQNLNKEYENGKLSTEKYLSEVDKLNTKIQTNNKIIAESSIELSKQKNERNANIKLINSEVGAYTNLSNQYSIAAKKAKDLAAQYGVNSDQAKKATATAAILGQKLKEIDGSVGQFGRKVGDYFGAIRKAGSNLFQSMGIIGGITALGIGIKDAAKTIKDFEKAMASLSAITGATGEDLKFLENSAKSMAQQYGKSAIEIVDSLKLVGSQRPDLLKDAQMLQYVTDKVMILSDATGMDLSTSASAVTAIMNQFGVSAANAGDIINSLAAGSLEGSAEVNNITESLKNFGTVAKDSNLTVEQSIALIEIMGEKQIFGAEAGTKLRGATLKLKDANLGYTSGQFDMNDAIDEANKKMAQFGTESEKDAYLQKLFGTENITVGKILLDNKEKFNQLTEAVTGTNVAMEQANKMNDTWAKDLEKAGSAWDNFILSLESGDGILSKALRGVTQWFTELMDSFSTLNTSTSSWKEKVVSVLDVFATIMPWLNQTKKSLEDYWGLTGKIVISEGEIKAAKERGKQAALDQLNIQKEQNTTVEQTIKLSPKEIEEINKKKSAIEKLRLEEEYYNEELERRLTLIMNQDDIDPLVSKTISNVSESPEVKANAISKQILTEQNDAWRAEEEEKQKEADQRKLDREKSIAETIKEFKNSAIDSAESYAQDIAAMKSDEKIEKIKEDAKIQEEIAKSQLDNGLITEEQYQAKIKEINKKARIEEAKANKQKSIYQIGIDTLTAVIKTFANLGWPAGIIPGIGVAAAGAVNAALVAAKPLPTFGQGTSDIVSIGNSHASGNDVSVWGFAGGQKQFFGKVEKGEAMPVIRKSAVNDYMVAKLNGKFSPSNEKTFANGTGNIATMQDNTSLINSMLDAFQNVKIVAKIEDITKEAGRKMQIVSNSKI